MSYNGSGTYVPPAGQHVATGTVVQSSTFNTLVTDLEQEFYKGRLEHEHGLEVLVPEAQDRTAVHRIIYEELVEGQIRDASRNVYREVIERLVARGAEAIILGCTEIMLLVSQEDSPVPLYDTTRLHAEAAVTRALNQR